MTTAINIVDERLRRSMSQKRLAHEAGIDARTLRKIEKGEVVSPETYRSVLTALGIEDTASQQRRIPDIANARKEARDGEGAIFPQFVAAFLMVIVPISAFLVGAWELSPNANIKLTASTACSEMVPEEALKRIAPEIGLERGRIDDVRHGTGRCSLDVSGYLDHAADSRELALGKLAELGYDAEVRVERRIFSK